MMNQPKDWRSIDEQIEILQERGLTITDREMAEHCLKRIGYYRLSGYWYPFRKFISDGSRADDFQEGSDFQTIIDLYLFDRELRLLVLDASERIELAIQTEIAHHLGQRDVFAQHQPHILHPNFTQLRPGQVGDTPYDRWLENYERLVNRAERKIFVSHNLDKYGQLPIWVAIEVWDFGTLSRFFSMMRVPDKLSIEAQFGLSNGSTLQTWLRALTFIRNVSAHHSRLWNCNIVDTASIPSQFAKLYSLKKERPFLYFCLMQKMLKIVSPKAIWGQRFCALMQTFPDVTNGAIQINDMGIVDGWEDWDLWKAP